MPYKHVLTTHCLNVNLKKLNVVIGYHLNFSLKRFFFPKKDFELCFSYSPNILRLFELKTASSLPL